VDEARCRENIFLSFGLSSVWKKGHFVFYVLKFGRIKPNYVSHNFFNILKSLIKCWVEGNGIDIATL
jgi:hypothetical protein